MRGSKYSDNFIVCCKIHWKLWLWEVGRSQAQEGRTDCWLEMGRSSDGNSQLSVGKESNRFKNISF